MPYTPPAQQSPAASGLASPAYSRNTSFVGPQLQHGSPPRSPGARPNLPRSLSSTAYLSKHRRSPSLHSDPQGAFTVEDVKPSQTLTINTSINASIRQSPPPATADNVTPIGLLVSPPDSTQNSSDEEGPTSRPDVDPKNLVELEQAVRRSLSPDMGRSTNVPTGSAEVVSGSNSDSSAPTPRDGPSRLTASARKISHSRSTTEASVLAAFSQSAAGSDDEDDQQFDRPPLLRKKSGELVKPAIRPHKTGRSRKHSSMPGTPRAVHFNDNMEQVRHFLQVDRPIAVSAGASPVDPMDDEAEFPFRFPSHASSNWEIRLCNFPRESHERSALPVRVERIFLSADQRSLIGHVAAANIAFHKQVVARFTFDSWKTTSEVVAEYNNDTRQKPREDGYDQFNFNIALTDHTKLASKTLMICARYNVNGQELWDNNNSMNYIVEFLEQAKPRADLKNVAVSNSTSPSPTSGPGAIPRSRHNSPAARPRSMPTFEDDFAVDFDATTPLKLKPAKAILPDEPSRKSTAVGQAFGSRYDFGASLTAALTNVQATIADRSVRNARASQPAPKPRAAHAPAPVPRSHGLGTDSPRPDTLIASNQTVDSKAYQDFVSKFCFYGSNTKPGAALPKPKSPPQAGDGAQDEKTGSQHIDFAISDEQPSPFDASILSSPSFLSPNEHSSSSDNSPLHHELSGRSSAFGFPFHNRTPPILG